MADTPSGALREDSSTSSTQPTTAAADETAPAAKKPRRPRAPRATARSRATEAPSEAAPSEVADGKAEEAKPARKAAPRRRAPRKAAAKDARIEASGDGEPAADEGTPGGSTVTAGTGAPSAASTQHGDAVTAADAVTAEPPSARSTPAEPEDAVTAGEAVTAEAQAPTASPTQNGFQNAATSGDAGTTKAASPSAAPTQNEPEVARDLSAGPEPVGVSPLQAPPAISRADELDPLLSEDLPERAEAVAAVAQTAPGPEDFEASFAGPLHGADADTTEPSPAAEPVVGIAGPSGRTAAGSRLARRGRREQPSTDGDDATRPEVSATPRREEAPVRRIREDGELPHDRLDEDAVKVVTRLHQYGHEAYLVGGCVRDLLLDRAPKDFDVATSATPNEVRGIFRNCRLIGRRFRLAHVYFRGGKVIEVSTFRANPTELEGHGHAEGEDGNGSAEGDLLITHDNVFGTAEEDARRRDFTMNGLFYDVEAGRVIDFVHGRRDLTCREIRTIGDPEVRMREDPVRILRAVRFATKLELDLESRTYAAMEGAVEDLARCAPARLLEETFRLLRGGYAEGSLKLLHALDALRILLPPLGEALREGGSDAETRCWAFAAALDEVVRSGEELEDSLLLAALLIPITGRVPVEEDDEQRQTMSTEVETLLAELVQSARLPRRIAERARHLLFAQQILSGQRRRRGGQASFRRHPVYGDALRLFEMTVKATGEHREALAAWKAGSAPAPAEGDEASGPRRRRRFRRRGPNGASSQGGGE